MSEWDFLWDLSGKDLEVVMTSEGTDNDWAYVEKQERKKRKVEWEKLKSLREGGLISKEEFKKRKTDLFSNDINV